MSKHLILVVLFIWALSACHLSHSHGEGAGAGEAERHGTTEADQHGTTGADQHGEGEVDEEAEKVLFTAYSGDFELFAEADPLVMGDTSYLLSHFSTLPHFKPLEEAKITLLLTVNGKESRQTVAEPSRKGIWRFAILPQEAGKGALRFEVENQSGHYAIEVPDVTVYPTHREAHAAAENSVFSMTNSTVFTKEQSWKIDFATDFPKTGSFGQVIKTTGWVEAAPAGEMVITAKSSGVVLFPSIAPVAGMAVRLGETLCTISGKGFIDNNMDVRWLEAKSHFEKAAADYERAKTLAPDNIVSEKDLLTAKTAYETAKALFDNLNQNIRELGQTLTSPLSGFVKQLFVAQGSFVEVGRPIMVVSQNKILTVTADLPLRYASLLPSIESATLRSHPDSAAYSLEALNGKVLSYAKAATPDNPLLPVTLQIENNGQFVAGSFVELFLKTAASSDALTVPVSALLEMQGLYFVWVQITPELFEKREVKIGGTDGIWVEIRQGLSAGERIVTRGAMPIKLAQATGLLDPHSGHVH
ncbi:MAG: efflux RND transporter periplasmic adaptor subunit [Bacteroidales bacterium]